MPEEKQTTVLERVLKGFIEEQGIKDAEELAAVMQAVEENWPFTADGVRAVMDDPGSMDCVFVSVAGDALASDETQSEERARALLNAATEDIRARKKSDAL